jgi:hypothetical protein
MRKAYEEWAPEPLRELMNGTEHPFIELKIQTKDNPPLTSVFV